MRNIKAEMFNKKASDPKSMSEQIIKSMDLKTGHNIADIGSGGGYFSLKFARSVGEHGKVYAVDKDPNLLNYIKEYSKEKGVKNIIPILIENDKMDLHKENLDFIFMRNVTHHISDRVEYFSDLKYYLKEEGKIIIIEYKKAIKFSFRGIFRHYVPKDIIVEEMKKAGYKLDKEFDILPEQHFTVYSKTE